MRRVAITGLGVICALGHDLQQTWHALQAGHSGIRPLQLVDSTQLRFRNAAEVCGYNSESHFDPAAVSLLDRFAQFAVIAARQATRQSGLDFRGQLAGRASVITGSSLGGKPTE